MRNAEGYRNHWFGWTQADNDKWGWASASTPRAATTTAGSAAGRRTATADTARPRRTPGYGAHLPTVRRTRADTDPGPKRPSGRLRQGRRVPPTDCDDTNSRVYPGAQEVANDGIDQDCNAGDAAGRVSALVAFDARSSRTSTRFKSLRVTEAPAGATVAVTCTGKRKGCPKSQTFTTSAKGSVSLTRMFRKRLRVGATVTVAVTTPNAIGKVRRLTMPARRAWADALSHTGSGGAGEVLTALAAKGPPERALQSRGRSTSPS